MTTDPSTLTPALLAALSDHISRCMHRDLNYHASKDPLIRAIARGPTKIFLEIDSDGNSTKYRLCTRNMLNFPGGKIPAGMYHRPDKDLEFYVLRHEHTKF